MIQLISAMVCVVLTFYFFLQHIFSGEKLDEPNFLDGLLDVSPMLLFCLISLCWFVNSASFFWEGNGALTTFTTTCFVLVVIVHVRSYVSRLW